MSPEDCSICNGTGFKIVKRGGYEGAADCDCTLERRVKALTERSGIPLQFRGAQLGLMGVEHLTGDPVSFVGVGTAIVKVDAYINCPPAKRYPPGMLLMGPPGTGKTALGVCILRAMLATGRQALFLDCGNLLQQVRATFGAKSADQAEALTSAMESDVVMLDDLGAQANQEWVRDTISQVITHRYNHQKPLIVTTALKDDELAKLGERTASRLREMCHVVQIPPGVEDYRKNNAGRRRKGT